MFKLTKATMMELIEDSPALNTLNNQYTADEIWDALEDKDKISDDEELFNALMAVMYATRPKGVL